MTDMVRINKGGDLTQLSMADIQEKLAAREEEDRKALEETGSSLTKKARGARAKKTFSANPSKTLSDIRLNADVLSNVFDETITADSVPLTQAQINTLSEELRHVEKIQEAIAAIAGRYKEIIFAHMDRVVTRIPGRPASQTKWKVAADTPGPHHVFERRGGDRNDPNLDTEAMRGSLPADIAAQLFLTIHHDAVDAWDEEVFDEARFLELVNDGKISLDLVGRFLTPGTWRPPSFHAILVDDDAGTGSGDKGQ